MLCPAPLSLGPAQTSNITIKKNIKNHQDYNLVENKQKQRSNFKGSEESRTSNISGGDFERFDVNMKVVQCFSFGNFMAREFYPKRNSWWRHCKQRRCRSCQNEFILCKLAFHRGLKAVTPSLNRSFSSEQNHRIKKTQSRCTSTFWEGSVYNYFDIYQQYAEDTNKDFLEI